MTTEFAFSVMEKILPDVVAILNDADVQAVRDDVRAKNVSALSGMERLMPLMCGAHREHVYAIVAAVSEKTVDEVKAQPFDETIKVWRGGFVDEMLAFFVPSLRMVLKA